MKINKDVFLKIILIFNLLALIYLPSFKLNIILEIISILLLLPYSKGVNKRIFGLLSPLLIVFFIGFVGFLTNESNLFVASKDVFHSLKPMLGIFLGFLIFSISKSFKKILQNIVLAGFLSSLIHLFIVLFFTNFLTGSINEIRDLTRDNFLDLIALFLLLFHNKFFGEQLVVNKYRKYFILVISISCVLYFSRTMIIAAILFLITFYGYSKITLKSIKIFSIIFVSIVALYSYLYSVKIERNKPGIEAFLYKIKIAPEEIFETNINRDNHKDLWDHWRAYEAKRALSLLFEDKRNILFGCGYGSEVNLKFKAPLDGPEGHGLKYISELHNGYIYVLYKFGIAGILIYLFMLIKLYLFNKNSTNFNNLMLSFIGLFYFFTSFTITGMYNNRDIIVIILGLVYSKFLFDKSNYNGKEII